MKLKIILSGLIMTLALASCGGPANPLATLVPAESLAFVQVENPKVFMSNLDQFVKPLGLEAITKGKSSRELLDDFAKKSEGQFDPAWFDWDRPIGLAILGSKEKSDDPKAIFYIPLKDADKNFTHINAWASTSESTNAQLFQSYAILSFGLKTPPTFPVQNPLDFSALNTFEKGGISYYIDFNSIKTVFGFEKNAALSFFSAAFEESESKLLLPQQKVMSMEMVKALVELVDQATHMSSSTILDGTGLRSQGSFQFFKDGGISKFLQDFAPVKGTQESLRFLSQDSLFKGVVNLPSENMKKLTGDVMNWALKSFFSDSAKLEEHAKIYQPLIDLMGSRTVFNVDVDFDMATILGLKDSQAAQDLEKAFDLACLFVSDVKDGPAYEQALKSYYASQVVKDMMASAFQGMDLPMDLDFVFTPDQKEGDFKYSTLVLKSTILPSDKPRREFEEINKVFQFLHALYSKFTIYVHTTPNKVFMVMGKDGLKSLRSVVEKDAVYNSLSESKTLKTFQTFLPDDANLVTSFSLRRLAQLISKSGISGSQLIPQLSEDSPGVFGYAKIVSGHIETGSVWSIKEIAEISKAVSAFLPMLLNMAK